MAAAARGDGEVCEKVSETVEAPASFSFQSRLRCRKKKNIPLTLDLTRDEGCNKSPKHSHGVHSRQIVSAGPRYDSEYCKFKT